MIYYHKHFLKAYDRLQKNLQKKVDDKILIFSENPYQKELNNHTLSGKWLFHRSINITGDCRAVFRHLSQDDVIFVIVGTHHQLYGS